MLDLFHALLALFGHRPVRGSHEGLIKETLFLGGFQTSYGAFGRVLSEKLVVGERRVRELVVIVLGAVKEFTIRRMQLIIVFRVLDIEV